MNFTLSIVRNLKEIVSKVQNSSLTAIPGALFAIATVDSIYFSHKLHPSVIVLKPLHHDQRFMVIKS